MLSSLLLEMEAGSQLARKVKEGILIDSEIDTQPMVVSNWFLNRHSTNLSFGASTLPPFP